MELRATEAENDGSQDMLEASASQQQRPMSRKQQEGAEKDDGFQPSPDLTASLLASSNFENMAVLGNLNPGSGLESTRSSFAEHG